MNMTTRVLADTQKLLTEEETWRKGGSQSMNRDGMVKRCLSGAICTIVGIMPHQANLHPLAAEVIGVVAAHIQTLPAAHRWERWYSRKVNIAKLDNVDWLCAFNDHPKTSHKRVLSLLSDVLAENDACEYCDGEMRANKYLIIKDGARPELLLCDRCFIDYAERFHA